MTYESRKRSLNGSIEFPLPLILGPVLGISSDGRVEGHDLLLRQNRDGRTNDGAAKKTIKTKRSTFCFNVLIDFCGLDNFEPLSAETRQLAASLDHRRAVHHLERDPDAAGVVLVVVVEVGDQAERFVAVHHTHHHADQRLLEHVERQLLTRERHRLVLDYRQFLHRVLLVEGVAGHLVQVRAQVLEIFTTLNF